MLGNSFILETEEIIFEEEIQRVAKSSGAEAEIEMEDIKDDETEEMREDGTEGVAGCVAEGVVEGVAGCVAEGVSGCVADKQGKEGKPPRNQCFKNTFSKALM